MPAHNPHQPDSHFASLNLINAWYKLKPAFPEIRDTRLREALSQLSETSLNHLTLLIEAQQNPSPDPDHIREARIRKMREEDVHAITVDIIYATHRIPPENQALCDAAVNLYLDSLRADSTLAQRLEWQAGSRKINSGYSPSGLFSRPRQKPGDT